MINKKRILYINLAVVAILLLIFVSLVSRINAINEVEKTYILLSYMNYQHLEREDTSELDLQRSLLGGIDAYERTHEMNFNNSNHHLLPYALIVANRYHNRMACRDVFYILKDIYGPDTLDSLDVETKKLAHRYLKMSQLP